MMISLTSTFISPTDLASSIVATPSSPPSESSTTEPVIAQSEQQHSQEPVKAAPTPAAIPKQRSEIRPKPQPTGQNSAVSRDLAKQTTSANSNHNRTVNGPTSITSPSTKANYLNNPKPVYPKLSRRLKEEGKVILNVLVSIDGRASQVKIKRSSGYSRLDDSALNAARQWRFVPAKRGNTAIEMWYELPIIFSLTE